MKAEDFQFCAAVRFLCFLSFLWKGRMKCKGIIKTCATKMKMMGCFFYTFTPTVKVKPPANRTYYGCLFKFAGELKSFISCLFPAAIETILRHQHSSAAWKTTLLSAPLHFNRREKLFCCSVLYDWNQQWHHQNYVICMIYQGSFRTKLLISSRKLSFGVTTERLSVRSEKLSLSN